MNEIKLEKPIEPPILVFDGGEGKDPILALEHHRLGPYSKPEVNKVEIPVFLPSNYERENEFIKGVMSDIINGLSMDNTFKEKGIRSRWWGFEEIYGVKLDFKIENYDWDENNVSPLVQIVGKKFDSQRNVLVIIYLPLSRCPIGGPYFQLKAAFMNSIQTQMILRDTFDKYNKMRNQFEQDPWHSRDYAGFLWNLSLSIFTKLGGVPWKLKEPIKEVTGFIGLATQYRPLAIKTERRGIASVQLFNNWGEYDYSASAELSDIWRDEENRPCFDVKKIEKLISDLASELKRTENKEYVICHITDLYSTEILDAIVKTLQSEGFDKTKILRIQDKGPLLLYDNSVSKSAQGWPFEGTYWFLEKGKLAQLYTSGAWQYSALPTFPPYSIPANISTPIQVVLEEPSNEKLNHEDLKHILWLSNLHFYSTDIPRIRMPVNLRLARRLARVSASEEKTFSKLDDITYLY